MGDLPAIRNTRLAALETERRNQLAETMTSLDVLLDALDNRAERIATGAVKPSEQDDFNSIGTAGLNSTVPANELGTEEPEPETTHEAVNDNAAPAPETDDNTASSTVAPPQADDNVVVLEAADDSDVDTAELDHENMPLTSEVTTAPPTEEFLAPVPEEEEPPSPGWTRRAELLYDDMLRLFRLGDSDGALISLERLLTSTPLNQDLEEFVEVNEERLMELYKSVLGSWAECPVRAEEIEGPIPPAFLTFPKIASTLAFIDGHTSFSTILSSSKMTRLETAAVLSQLVRSKIIVVEES